MKNDGLGSGLVRNLDQLGRVVLPVQWRRTLDLGPGAPIEILPGGEGALMLRRYVPNGACVFCGEIGDGRIFAGRPVCTRCTTQLIAGMGA